MSERNSVVATPSRQTYKLHGGLMGASANPLKLRFTLSSRLRCMHRFRSGFRLGSIQFILRFLTSKYKLISHYPDHCVLPTQISSTDHPVTSNFSSRAFSVSALSTWNSLPAHIRSIDTLSTFKRHRKFHFFQSAFTV